MGRALEQSRMDIEDVAGKSLATGGPTEQERELAIGPRMMREVVVDDKHVAPLFHEGFGDARRSVRCDISNAGRLVAFGGDDHRVVHRTFFAEASHDLGYRRRALADRTIDADHVRPTLVQDGVNRDGGLAGLAIAQNQFALTAPDGNERIDNL